MRTAPRRWRGVTDRKSSIRGRPGGVPASTFVRFFTTKRAQPPAAEATQTATGNRSHPCWGCPGAVVLFFIFSVQHVSQLAWSGTQATAMQASKTRGACRRRWVFVSRGRRKVFVSRGRREAETFHQSPARSCRSPPTSAASVEDAGSLSQAAATDPRRVPPPLGFRQPWPTQGFRHPWPTRGQDVPPVASNQRRCGARRCDKRTRGRDGEGRGVPAGIPHAICRGAPAGSHARSCRSPPTSAASVEDAETLSLAAATDPRAVA